MPNGKICYVEIPTTDPDASARFYANVFGWQSRTRGDGAPAFDDTTGQVSGSFVKGRAPHRGEDVIVYVMVDDIEATLMKVTENGGSVRTQRTELGRGDAYALFLDLCGNLFGLYQGSRGG